MENQPATKQDIKDLLGHIKEDIQGIKTEVKELHTKSDHINHKLRKHGMIINILTIIVILILTGIVGKVFEYF